MPRELSLPGIDNIDDVLNMIISASVDGAARVDEVADGAEYLPLGDSGSLPGAGGVTIARKGSVSQTVTGVKKGTYSQAVVGSGFAASAEVATAPGVRDRVSGSPEDERVRFASLTAGAPERPVELQLAADARSATIRTRTSGAGSETAALGRTPSYEHQGAPTEFSFSLGSVRREGGPVAFESRTLRIGRGDRVTATPGDWDRLGRVRLVVRHRGGGTTRRVLRNRAAPCRARRPAGSCCSSAPATACSRGEPSQSAGRARARARSAGACRCWPAAATGSSRSWPCRSAAEAREPSGATGLRRSARPEHLHAISSPLPGGKKT